MYVRVSMRVCVCMYVCMRVCMYVCNVCMYVYMYVCMHVCIYACMYVCMHAFMHADIKKKEQILIEGAKCTNLVPTLHTRRTFAATSPPAKGFSFKKISS